MIYGYLRVSSDEQDVNSQKQGVEAFAKEKGWTIEEYITDEGVSGGKDPSKRNLGPLLNQLKKGDIVICSEISRLGRDLYMVMDILHFCMQQECIICTVKDRFVLGDDIQSKVLAFAFGLAAEIERQMIRQRTKEGLKLRMKMGSLVGRPYLDREAGERSGTDVRKKMVENKEQIITQHKWGVPFRRLAQNFGVDRNTLYRYLIEWGCYDSVDADGGAKRRAWLEESMKKLNDKHREQYREQYKETPLQIVDLDREKMMKLIQTNLILPDIAKQFPELTYEQVYDTVLADRQFNTEYRKYGQKKCAKKK